MTLPGALTVDDARRRITRLYDRRCALWLRGGGEWPLRFALGRVNEASALQDMAAVRQWVLEWQAASNRLQGTAANWVDRRWQRLGLQRLPTHLVFEGPLGVAQFIGHEVRWQSLTERYVQLIEVGVAPNAAAGAARNLVGAYSDDDFGRLLRILQWAINGEERAGIYLRQIPIAGIDTKWIEQHRATVEALLREVVPGENESADLYELLGLSRPPSRLRIRVLDAALRCQTGGLSDVEAPVTEIAALDLEPACVLIIENVEPGLALQDRSGTVAIMGLGYAVEILREILWIAQAKQCLYWGDLDTHGFACLARARHHIPKLKSILMDERTLHENQTMWVHEPSPIVIDAPEILTAAEQAVYEALRDNGWGQGVRLEQERIPPKHVLIALEAAAKEVT